MKRYKFCLKFWHFYSVENNVIFVITRQHLNILVMLFYKIWNILVESVLHFSKTKRFLISPSPNDEFSKLLPGSRTFSKEKGGGGLSDLSRFLSTKARLLFDISCFGVCLFCDYYRNWRSASKRSRVIHSLELNYWPKRFDARGSYLCIRLQAA